MRLFRRALAKYRTQKVAAEAWGMSPGYLNDIANGRRDVSVNTALKIETATGILARDMLAEQTAIQLEKARERLAQERRLP